MQRLSDCHNITVRLLYRSLEIRDGIIGMLYFVGMETNTNNIVMITLKGEI